jgi:hypothetical protein
MPTDNPHWTSVRIHQVLSRQVSDALFPSPSIFVWGVLSYGCYDLRRILVLLVTGSYNLTSCFFSLLSQTLIQTRIAAAILVSGGCSFPVSRSNSMRPPSRDLVVMRTQPRYNYSYNAVSNIQSLTL